jgi:hypothetical protein
MAWKYQVIEADWLASENPHNLLSQLGDLGIGSKRKFRLAAAGCCRRAWHLLSPVAQQAVEVVERYADGRAKYVELKAAAANCLEDWGRSRTTSLPAAQAAAEAGHREAPVGLGYALFRLLGMDWSGLHPNGSVGGCWQEKPLWEQESRAMCAILRDVFGNPFRPVTLDPRCRSRDVVALARAIYEEGNFDKVSILGDALEDAGCAEEAILDHCRSAGPHVKGCWVVDAVRAKK